MRLRTSRVVVVDDKPNEAVPILRILGTLGVGALYFRGDVISELPSRPISGIRVIFIDMDLLGNGGEAKVVVGNTVSVLEKIVTFDSGPAVIVTWTQHNDYVATFRAQVRRKFPAIKPQCIVCIKKPSSFGKRDMDRIRTSIEGLVNEAEPLYWLWQWEQHVHDAASLTLRRLTEVIDKKLLKAWDAEMMKILASLAKAACGRASENAEDVADALYSALNTIHAESLMELSRGASGAKQKLRNLAKEARKVQSKKNPLTVKQRGMLNRVLLFAENTERGFGPVPGSVFTSTHWAKSVPFPVSKAALKKNKFIASLCSGQRLPQDPKDRRKFLRCCYPFVVEITPSCDYAQGKVSRARFLMGAFISTKREGKIGSGQHLKTIGKVYFDRRHNGIPKGSYSVKVSSHFMTEISLTQIRSMTTSMKFRRQTLVDLQAWLSSRSSRPGIISLND